MNRLQSRNKGIITVVIIVTICMYMMVPLGQTTTSDNTNGRPTKTVKSTFGSTSDFRVILLTNQTNTTSDVLCNPMCDDTW